MYVFMWISSQGASLDKPFISISHIVYSVVEMKSMKTNDNYETRWCVYLSCVAFSKTEEGDNMTMSWGLRFKKNFITETFATETFNKHFKSMYCLKSILDTNLIFFFN